jgi:hypothetical protein
LVCEGEESGGLELVLEGMEGEEVDEAEEGGVEEDAHREEGRGGSDEHQQHRCVSDKELNSRVVLLKAKLNTTMAAMKRTIFSLDHLGNGEMDDFSITKAWIGYRVCWRIKSQNTQSKNSSTSALF